MDLAGKIIIVTGASSGLGLEIARKLADRKAVLILIANDDEGLLKVRNELEPLTTTHTYTLDIKDVNALTQVINEITTRFNNIDILVNNAGVWTDDLFEQTHPERITEAFQTNVIAGIHITKLLLPSMRERNRGYIFNVISSAGESDSESSINTDWKAYGATKWAMTGFTRALAKELQETNIRVTSFHPGGFESNLYENVGWPKGREHNQPWMMKATDLANIVVFALSTPEDVQIERLMVTKKQLH